MNYPTRYTDQRRGQVFSKETEKNHTTNEPLIQKELTKFLDARIIYKVQNSTWVSNSVRVRKKSGEIHLSVGFHNLNCTLDKENYLVLSMENILQTISRAYMFSFFDGRLGYK